MLVCCVCNEKLNDKNFVEWQLNHHKNLNNIDSSHKIFFCENCFEIFVSSLSSKQKLYFY